MKDRSPDDRESSDTPLLWITGCTVGAAHPCPAAVENAQAWQALELACAASSKWDSEGTALAGGDA